MRISFRWRHRGLKAELAANPEVLIFVILLTLATILGRKEPGALGYCQIWGLSVALGALWVIVFPRYFQDAFPPDIVVTSIFVLILGSGIIFAHWVEGWIQSMRLVVAGENESMAATSWTWVIGGLTAASGLLGILLCRRLSLAIRSSSSIVIRSCAVLILFAAILLIVRATLAGNELLQIGTNGG